MREKIPAAIFDLDGTLVDVDSIRHFVDGEKKDFDAFHRASIDAPPNLSILSALRFLSGAGIAILVVSGRSNSYSKLTDFWLAQHEVPTSEVLLRSKFDRRADVEVKTDMYFRLATRYQICWAFDDNEDLLLNWRALGINDVFDAKNYKYKVDELQREIS